MQFLSYQSLCTRILSNRLRVEEDIDDGSHTTIRKIQVDGELKRFGILDEEEKDSICAQLGNIFKNRIRDM